MKNHTVGIVVGEWSDASNNRFVKIMWGMKGEMMPRASHDYYFKHNIEYPHWQSGPEGGNKDVLWYSADKDYFKVIQ
jgi:hypothetical protein